MRKEEHYGMKVIHSRLFLTMFYTLLFMVMVGLCGCSGGGGNGSGSPGKKVFEAIAVRPADNQFAVGETKQFELVDTYKDGTTTPNTSSPVIWSSDDDKIATIDPNTGIATGVAPGKITITAAFGDEPRQTRTTTLTVPDLTLASITISPVNPTIASGTTQQFTATGAYSDGSFQVLTSGVTWRSSDPSKTTIDQNGRATAIAAGPAVISAEVGSVVSPVTNLTVTPATLASIAVTSSSQTIAVGTTQQFIATGTLSNGTTQDLTSQAIWSSSDPSKTTIDQNGKATAIAAGTAVISAAVGGIVSPVTSLTVTPASLVSIAVTSPNRIMAAGTTEQFSATGTFSDSTTQNLTSQVTWISSDVSITAIDRNGIATAMGAGTATITASYGGVSGTQNLDVTNAAVAGIWDGTYTIYESIDTSEIGTYKFKFDIAQNGTNVSGTSSLRYDIPGQKADGQFIEGIVTGSQLNFTFTYIDPRSSHKMVNIGTATITDTSMTGTVLENYNGGYNCSYIFSLKKL